MSEELVNVTRGPLVESIHRGDIAVVDYKGKLINYIGDPYKVTYLRSALKPIQTLNVFLSGAQDKYNFNDKEISIMCASHYGEDFHRKTVEDMLNKIDMSIGDLLCGAAYSLSESYKIKQIEDHITLTALNTDCSGKHVGMIASAINKGYKIEGYNLPSHPIQQDIQNTIADFCQYDFDKILIGIDGCSVPVHGMPLYNAALGFAKLAKPDDLEPDYKKACTMIFNAMNNAPEMVSGTGGFCTELIKNAHGKLIGKLGAEGVYCIGIKEKGIGIAIKIEDGNYSRAISPTVIRCLEDLNVLEPYELDALRKFKSFGNKNNVGSMVGEVVPNFHLNKGR